MPYRLAVVEDEAIVAHSIEQKLVKLGYEVGGVFYKAEELLSFLGNSKVDLILMDIQLQNGMSGIEAAEEILKRYHIPLVYLTAFSDDTTLEKAAKTEPYGYLIKPFNDRELKATVEMALYKASSLKELAYREARWEAMFQNIREGLVVADQRGLVISVNPTMESLVGLSLQEMKHKSLDDLFLFSPQVGKGERLVVLEVKKTGFRIPVYWDSSLMVNQYGEHLGAVHMFHDMSEVMEYERALSQSEERYRRLVEDQTDWLVRMAEDGTILYANRAMALSLGWEAQQIHGQNFFDIVPLTDRKKWQEVLSSLESSEEVASLELDYERYGVRYVIEWRFRCVHMSNQPHTCREFQGVGRDITLLRETEEALREEDEFLKRILMSIDEGVVIVDEKGEIEFANPRGKEILSLGGEEKGQLMEKVVFELQGTGKVEDFGLLLQNIQNWPVGVWTITNRRQKRYELMIDLSLLGGTERSQREYVLLMTDMTLFNQLQQEFYRAQRLEAMEVLAGGIAHDFNNILTVILGNISLLKMRLGDSSPETKEYLQEAESACERAKKLTTQMLSFARGGAPVIKQENILQMIEDTVRFLLQGSSIRWHIEKKTENVSIPVDIGQLAQVIQNLVLNAREAMKDGGELTIVLNNISAEELQGRVPEPLPGVKTYLSIEVKDNGPGIDPAVLPRIFEPYVSTKARGSGLGLAIVYTIIRKHHGCIEVDSRPGEGTTFSLFLPVYAVEEERKEMALSSEEKKLSGDGKRVWILDDEIGIVRVLEKSLRQRGYRVESFQESAEFLKQIGEISSQDVVIMDITMPGDISVEERLKRVYAVAPEVRMILISGYAKKDLSFPSHEGILFLTKPFTVQELLEKMYELLQEKGISS
ncbi:MAG: PAS domain S-box protein [Brevinematales bacterium]|nr:PAS domain S-box protein [Brevinematales bacterium]